MDQDYIHVLITHLPIFGSILGALVLVQGIWRKSKITIIASYTIFICSSLGGIIGYLTGEGAEETVEKLQGISENAIEAHEDFALYALIGLSLLGVVSIAGLIAEYKRSPASGKIARGLLFISLTCFFLGLRTGYLGGKIRHSDPAENVWPAQTPEGAEDDDH